MTVKISDGTIVSGDSLGAVKFWDSNTCTQLQSFQAHGADVLCLTIGPVRVFFISWAMQLPTSCPPQEGRSVYTSGVDQKVCQFSHVQVSAAVEDALPAPSHSRWIHTCSRRLHSHDVRAIAVWPPHIPLAAPHRPPTSPSGIAPVLVSGGLDMSLVICPCALPSSSPTNSNIVNPLASSTISTFEDAYHRRVAYSTGMSPAIQVAREAKLVLCRRETGLGLWRIKKSASPGEIGLADLEELGKKRGEDWEKVADMDLKVRTNLVASAISSDGRWVAASDLHETKLFRLVHGKVRHSSLRMIVHPCDVRFFRPKCGPNESSYQRNMPSPLQGPPPSSSPPIRPS
jgi:U3 small nucleolar RNA-associated protein 4